MKLYRLLFLNEGQEIFGENAFTQGFVALNVISDNMIVVFNPTEFMNAYEKNNAEAMAHSLRGYIEYRDEDEYVQISWSCSEKGWGPLLYQILLKVHETKWLLSDENLSSNAANVYNAMYKLSNLYHRKWVGDRTSRYECLQTDKIPQLANYPEDDIQNEEQFLQYLKGINVDPSQTGCFWAYKKKSHEDAIAKMLNAGKAFARKYGSNVIETLTSVAAPTFNQQQNCRTR